MHSTVAYHLSLHGVWKLENVKKIEEKNIVTSMTIPRDTASALYENGIIADPYYGENEHAWKWLGLESWKIRVHF